MEVTEREPSRRQPRSYYILSNHKTSYYILSDPIHSIQPIHGGRHETPVMSSCQATSHAPLSSHLPCSFHESRASLNSSRRSLLFSPRTGSPVAFKVHMSRSRNTTLPSFRIKTIVERRVPYQPFSPAPIETLIGSTSTVVRSSSRLLGGRCVRSLELVKVRVLSMSRQ